MPAEWREAIAHFKTDWHKPFLEIAPWLVVVFEQTYGLDAAFPAGFVAMVAPHFSTRNGRAAGLLGGLICLVTIPFVPVGVSILCAGVAVLVGVRRP